MSSGFENREKPWIRRTHPIPSFCPWWAITPIISLTLSALDLCNACIPNLVQIGRDLPDAFRKAFSDPGIKLQYTLKACSAAFSLQLTMLE